MDQANIVIGRYKSWINFNNKRIYIKRIYVKQFLDYIGDCPVESYKHKWKVKQLKNCKIDEGGPDEYIHLYDAILNAYNSKEPSSNLIHKFKIPYGVLRHILKTNKLKYINKELPINQFINNSYIKTWDSLTSIVLEHPDYDKSAIVKCCKNKRKTHKGHKWKYEGE
jgi:hypothetical protein